MTLQQLEYIVALDKYRHFVRASKKCGVSQPTLSLMIQKMESELGIPLFDRSKHPIEPTKMGVRLINQAKITLREMKKIGELVASETENLSGTVHLGVIPTLASYIVPEFIYQFRKEHPQISLIVTEMNTESLIKALQDDAIDLFIAATPLEQADFFEIPIYYEKFVAYFSETPLVDAEDLSADNMPKDNLWVLGEGHCLRDQTFNFCKGSVVYNQTFEAGSIETLIRIVDKNGGYSVIPELHISLLSDAQKKKVRAITNPPAIREVSIVIKKDFIKERLINAVSDTIKKIVPDEMIDSRLKKFAIKL
ncbi:MAG: LysR family transcriptional regulator [Flavobacteriaceae bacterium]|nr:MAG: LysR family transcriptional regulator [Flavobacteriaceae bacterium]